MQIKNKNMITIAIIVLGATLGIALIATYNPIGQANHFQGSHYGHHHLLSYLIPKTAAF